MSDAIGIAAGERHSLRVFALDMSPHEVQALRAAGRAGIADLLGVASVDPGLVEIIDTQDLGDLGLAGYLTEGSGVIEAQISADRALLDDQQGFVLIVYSGAFGGAANVLPTGPALSLIGTYAEDVPPVRFEELPSGSAAGVLTPETAKVPMSNARISGMVATVVLLLLFVFTALLVWTAG